MRCLAFAAKTWLESDEAFPIRRGLEACPPQSGRASADA
jgi:hypothetical protein